MTTKAQAAKAETPAAVKQAAARKQAAPKVTTGPRGKKMADAPTQDAPAVPVEQRQGERRQQVSNAMAQFAASSLQTPAVHEPTEEEKKLQALQEGVKALAASLGLDPSSVLAAPKQAKAARTDRKQQNGITRPGDETICGKIWNLADKLSTERGDGHPVAISALNKLPELKQVNAHTMKTQYARWRSYNGFKGRAPAQTDEQK